MGHGSAANIILSTFGAGVPHEAGHCRVHH